MKKAIGTAVLLLAVAAWAQAPPVVDITQEPHHQLLLENDTVRVFLEEIGAQKQTLFHKHTYDFVEVALTDSDISVERNGMGAANTLHRAPGDTHFVPGGRVHATANRDTAMPYRAVIVEARHGIERPGQVYDYDSSQAYLYDSFKVPLEPDKNYTLTYDTPALHAEKIQILVGAGIPSHSHGGGTLLIAVSDLELSHPAEGQPKPALLRLNKGEVVWAQGGMAYPLTNSGSQPAQFILLEFQP